MNKKMFFLALTAIVVSGIAMIPRQASAHQGDSKVQGPNYTAERHEAMAKAFANNDYYAWKSLMAGKGRATQVITQQDFTKFAEAHKLAAEGKMTEVNKIRAELARMTHDCLLSIPVMYIENLPHCII